MNSAEVFKMDCFMSYVKPILLFLLFVIATKSNKKC